jgi:hypothetical protein
MVDSKITALTSIGTITDPVLDQMVIVDVSDPSMAATGTTKKVTLNQLLATSPTATLASAAITGDLTVKTNVLKVDTTNNRVGIGTASPAAGNLLHISGTVAVPLLMQRTGSNDVYLSFTDNSGLFGYFGFSNGDLRFQTPGSSYANKYVISSDGTSTWSNVGGVAGTAMTLNSTGLGIGSSPSYKLHIGTSQASQTTIYVDNQANDPAASSALTLSAYGGSWNLSVPRSATFVNPLIFKFGATEMMRIDSSGNVGVGVTPSAWAATFKAIDIGSGCLVSQPANQTAGIFANAFGNGTNYTRKANGLAAGYDIFNGAHYWLNAPTGLAGTTFAFGNAAMTLDASGNLLVGTTGVAGSSSNATTLVLGGARSANGSVSALVSTATTIFSITASLRGRYEVVAMVAGSGSVGALSSIATVIWDGSAGRVVANNGTNLTITLSGSDVQITQTSATTQTVFWSFLRIAL